MASQSYTSYQSFIQTYGLSKTLTPGDGSHWNRRYIIVLKGKASLKVQDARRCNPAFKTIDCIRGIRRIQLAFLLAPGRKIQESTRTWLTSCWASSWHRLNNTWNRTAWAKPNSFFLVLRLILDHSNLGHPIRITG